MVLRFSLIFLLAGLLTSCDDQSTNSSQEVKPGETTVVPNGASLFMNHCSSCHGLDGKLGRAGAKDLTQTSMQYLDIKKTVETGTISGMPRFKELLGSEAAVESVVQYVMTLKN